ERATAEDEAASVPFAAAAPVKDADAGETGSGSGGARICCDEPPPRQPERTRPSARRSGERSTAVRRRVGLESVLARTFDLSASSRVLQQARERHESPSDRR